MTVFSHPSQPQMQVEVILASKGSNGAPPLYTIRMRYPRIIHAEIMTHRVFSRNARSSRAVPVKTMLDEVRNIPFVPWHWGKNQKGMQAGEDCNNFVPIEGMEDEELTREEAWHWMAEYSADCAEAYMVAGYHKQIPNRLLEPFSWIDTLITATDWANFLHLRDHKDAEPHLQDLARLVKQAIAKAEIQTLEEGQWHLPYIADEDRVNANMSFGATLLGSRHPSVNEMFCRLSAARCARISYKPFDGDASYERELERYNQLVTSERVHASPLEHQAKVDVSHYHSGGSGRFFHEDLSGNFAPGWIQFRKTIPGESFSGEVL